jgi:hypothetical protein
MKLVAEYRRRVLAVETLMEKAVCDDEKRELRKIARSWEMAARLREQHLAKNNPAPNSLSRR